MDLIALRLKQQLLKIWFYLDSLDNREYVFPRFRSQTWNQELTVTISQLWCQQLRKICWRCLLGEPNSKHNLRAYPQCHREIIQPTVWSVKRQHRICRALWTLKVHLNQPITAKRIKWVSKALQQSFMFSLIFKVGKNDFLGAFNFSLGKLIIICIEFTVINSADSNQRFDVSHYCLLWLSARFWEWALFSAEMFSAKNHCQRK